jgi:hypothetical protein
MAIDTLGANALASNSVTTAKIAADAVTSAKIPAGAVVASDVADGSVTTAKLAAGAVTTAKVADDAVTGAKLYAENLGRRNLIINGAMQVWQRATAATTAINAAYQTADRYSFNESTDGNYTTEQSTDTPTGTGYSLKAQVTTADTSIAAGQYAYIETNIEAQNLQSLLYGTSDAKSITLSFWVKSNKTGIYNILLRKLSGTDVHLVHEYTINAANTWEKKEITISPTAGSTSIITSATGAITADNNNGLQIGWNFAFGSSYNAATNNTWSTNTNHYATSNQVNWMDSTSNNFYLAQVQLEVGDTATPFEHRSFGEELSLCQRYFYPVCPKNISGQSIGMAYYYVSTTLLGIVHFPVTMRTAPTITGADVSNYFTTTHNDLLNYLLANRVTTTTLEFYNNSQASGTAMQAVIARSNNANAFIYATAEL